MPMIAGQQARLGAGRVGAFRLNYYSAVVKWLVAGIDRTSTIRKGTLTVRDVKGGQPNTCTFDTGLVPGWAPARGDALKIGLGAFNNLVFAGQISHVELRYQDKAPNLFYRISGIDWTRLLNRRLVWKTYTSQTATAILKDLISTFTSGFTSTQVPDDLGMVDSLVFSGVPVSEAIDEVAKAIGGAWWEIDEDRVLWFNTVANRPTPRTLTETIAKDFAYTADDRQARTRVIAKAGRSTVLGPVAVGASTVPVDDISPFIGASQAEVEGQIIAFSGTAFDVETADLTVGTLQTPSAPTPALGSSESTFSISGITRSGQTATATASSAHGLATGALIRVAGAAQTEYNGEFTVIVTGSTTFTYTVAGSPATPATGTITGQKIAAGRIVGEVRYKVSFVGPAGESELGSASSAVTGAQPAAPTVAPSVSAGHSATPKDVDTITRSGTTATVSTDGDHLFSNGLRVRIAGAGEVQYNGVKTANVALGGTDQFTFEVVGSPASPATGTITAQPVMGGDLVGTFKHAYSFVTDLGETALKADTTGITLAVVTAPGALTATVSSSVDGGLFPGGAARSRYYQVAYVTGNGGETPISTALATGATVTAVTAPGNPSLTGTSGGSLTLTSTYGYKITYYTAKGETTGSSGTSHTLTGSNNAISLSSIPTSSDGRVVGRKIYRTKAGGSIYYLVGTIGDNSSTTWTDGMPDSSLTELLPVSNTTGGQIGLTNIPTSSDARVVARRIYATKENESIGWYYLLATLQDNSTTTFTDTTPDSALTERAPQEGFAHGGVINVRNITNATDPRVRGRRLYRTPNGGTQFKLVATIGDNINGHTTYTDLTIDENLGVSSPAAPDPGGDQVYLTSVPIGPAGTTARKIHRTKAGGTAYFHCGTIPDNTATTFLDNQADADLTEASQDAVSTVATPAGSTTLRVSDLSKFQAAGGWVLCTGQKIRYTGRSASSGAGNLTGIPASGDGSIQTEIPADSAVVNNGLLTGVTAVVKAIAQGAVIRAAVTRNDTTAQTALAAREGGDGVHEHVIDLGPDATVAQATDAADDELTLFSVGETRVRWRSFDTNTRSGRAITVSMSSPHTGANGTYTIQDVTITGFEGARRADGSWQFPEFQAEAGPSHFGLEDLLRRVTLAGGQR